MCLAMSKIHPAIDSMRPDAARMVERLYRPLAEQLVLTPQQRETFYQILLEHKLSGLAQRAELLSHSDLSRLARTVAEFQKETDGRLLALLGQVKFSRYQEYQTGIADRGTLETIQSDFGQQPLSKEQKLGLLRAMSAARKAGGEDAGAHAGFSMADTSEVMDQKLKRQESVDQQVLQQAAAFLSTAQFQILNVALVRLQSWRKQGYAKAQEMFGDRATPRQYQS
jgi:hypothetical protein